MNTLFFSVFARALLKRLQIEGFFLGGREDIKDSNFFNENGRLVIPGICRLEIYFAVFL